MSNVGRIINIIASMSECSATMRCETDGEYIDVEIGIPNEKLTLKICDNGELEFTEDSKKNYPEFFRYDIKYGLTEEVVKKIRKHGRTVYGNSYEAYDESKSNF